MSFVIGITSTDKREGFIGNRPFFDRIDKYRRVLWRLPEYDLTYDLENITENEERKSNGFIEDPRTY